MGSRASLIESRQQIFFDSCRPTRVITHEQLGTSLAITSTPAGRSVKLKADPNQSPPYGLNNSAVYYSRHIQSLFNRAGWVPKWNSRPARHYVNMVTIQELPNDQASSTNSSTRSVPTEVINSEDEDYDLELPSYPPGFSHSRSFRPGGEISSSMSATTNRLSMERQTIRGNSANSAIPTVLGDVRTRNDNSRHITSAMLSTWSEINKSTKRQVLTCLLLWQT